MNGSRDVSAKRCTEIRTKVNGYTILKFLNADHSCDSANEKRLNCNRNSQNGRSER